MMNFPVILGAALIPTITGFLWYNPKVMGTVWMKAADMTEEKMKGANMAVIFGVSIFLSILLSMEMNFMAVHQAHLHSLLMGVEGYDQEGSEVMKHLNEFLALYGDRHRTFGHGFVHGIFSGLFFVLPVMGTNALFERKGFKYIAVNVGYWILTLALMGGVICQWG